jgi:diacylglycerol kinase (ATP)
MHDATLPEAPPHGSPALAILPVGTANDFFRSLGVPFDVHHAVAAIEQATLRRLDVVRAAVDGHNQWMINAAAGGNAAEVVRRLNAQQKQRWGAWCYVRGVVDVAADLKNFSIRLSLDDQRPIEFSSFNIIVANGRTAATLDVASRANLEDGQVEVVVIQEGPLFETARVAADFVAGDYLENEHVFYRRAKTVRVECDRGIGFSIDGELHLGKSFEFIVHPAALPTVIGNHYSSEPASHREP